MREKNESPATGLNSDRLLRQCRRQRRWLLLLLRCGGGPATAAFPAGAEAAAAVAASGYSQRLRRLPPILRRVLPLTQALKLFYAWGPQWEPLSVTGTVLASTGTVPGVAAARATGNSDCGRFKFKLVIAQFRAEFVRCSH
jgi:hypothetical protein